MASEYINARTVLWYVTFFGFAVNYMVRITINISIVAMVRSRINMPGQLQSECFAHDIANTSTLDSGNITSHVQEGFPWDEREQGMVLGSFFWLHWITQIPGGLLAQRYGGKCVFGFSQLSSVLLCFFMPAAAYYDLNALLLLRLLQGFTQGLAWPAMHTMTGRWIPPNERSNFVTAYLGSSVGTALTYPMYGLIIDWYGWEYVFHATGILGLLWFLAWWMLVFDSPAVHPRISEEEKNYIQKSLGQTSNNKRLKVPWKSILISKPLWLNFICQWGGVWGLFTILIQAPTYFKMIHGWDVRTTGFLSGLPHLVRMGLAYLFSLLGDYLLRNNKMSRTNVRKLATVVCNLVQGVLTLILAFIGCNSVAAIVLVTAATGVHGAVSTGPLASVVDISPNFAGISLGLINMLVAMTGFISPAIVGALTLNNQTTGQWQIVFLISAAMLISSGVLYVLWADSEVQPWNDPEEKRDKSKPLLSLDKVPTSTLIDSGGN